MSTRTITKSLRWLAMVGVVVGLGACSDINSPINDTDLALSLTDKMTEKHSDATVIETTILDNALDVSSGIDTGESPENTVEQSG